MWLVPVNSFVELNNFGLAFFKLSLPKLLQAAHFCSSKSSSASSIRIAFSKAL
jgi:hypothetical protein